MVSDMPTGRDYDKKMIERFEKTKETVSSIRAIRKEKNIPNKSPLSLNVKEKEEVYDNRFGEVLKKLCFLSEINFIAKKMEGAVSFIVKTKEFYIPLGDKINAEEEIRKLENELEYTRGFLRTVMQKLDNGQFINNAPEKVIQMELIKKADAEEKIRVLEERIAGLKKP